MAQSPTVDKTIEFDPVVIEKIAGKTAANVDGILALQGNLWNNLTDRLSKDDNPTHGIDVDIDKEAKTVALKLTGILEYGKNAPTVFDRLSKNITESVTNMTDLTVTKIDLVVKDMLTHDEWTEQSKKLTKKKPD
ncbi:Asp23/Gls24 family envelope stress response protein [Levilactobacillus bambusae]|uniref:Stress response regulator gls24 homolog n=1 Tax=Levilactobacillus bambusae TaxID=2024736 RepID=A0A2V1MZG6_9LACO|nr:Asp23/Gls24 family envelope stress response protein [Levilactobacillus bambusae]PWF99489.1 Asp23/Gls24 family envelope stress response protein [Levilactobacillus bambusae]